MTHTRIQDLAEQCPEKDRLICDYVVLKGQSIDPLCPRPLTGPILCVMRGQGRTYGGCEERGGEEKNQVDELVWVVFNSGTSMMNAVGWLVVSSLSSSTGQGSCSTTLELPPCPCRG